MEVQTPGFLFDGLVHPIPTPDPRINRPCWTRVDIKRKTVTEHLTSRTAILLEIPSHTLTPGSGRVPRTILVGPVDDAIKVETSVLEDRLNGIGGPSTCREVIKET